MDTLYLKLPQKKNVTTEKLLLGDIADIICTNQSIENRSKAILLKRFSKTGKQRAIFSVSDIINEITTVSSGVTVVPMGEVDTIVEYIPKPPRKFVEILLVVIVSLIAFVGAAFTIMTFNNDTSTGKLFTNIYEQFTGQKSDGFTVIELFYSIGLPLGIIIFFNHFFGRKITTDPTPLEVEMKQYEYNVNTSLVAENSRKDHLSNAYKSFSGSDRSS